MIIHIYIKNFPTGLGNDYEAYLLDAGFFRGMHLLYEGGSFLNNIGGLPSR